MIETNVVEMEGKTEIRMTSAASFVEGGIQESCDDACSICLEEFCASDPSTVTTCKHEFHLQCILEWCQRSSQCPICWQPISLKDPTSQELFEAVEQERSWRATPSRNAAIFHHPAFGDFELQHLRMNANDADFEERIIQHLAAAATMRRVNQLGRREGQQTRSSPHVHPHFLVFSNQPIAPSSGLDPVSRGENDPTAIPNRSPSAPITSDGNEASQQILHLQTQSSSSASGSPVMATNRQGIYSNDSPQNWLVRQGLPLPYKDYIDHILVDAGSQHTSSRDSCPRLDIWRLECGQIGSTARSSPVVQDRAESSELQSFSDSLRSRLNAVSMRYKESISKGTRGWKERLFSHSSSMSELGSETRRREMKAGIASVSRLMESLETSENNRAVGTSLSNQNHIEDSSMGGVSNQNNVEASGEKSSHDDNTPAACSASSHLN
ncbi:E3 ubiquitin-protein ligase RHF2A [Glycine max]|nr:E3 ubiquitin-protein ligase RHF2A [Glycine max]KAH1195478.1 E3 ubiquitin-protein ligase RHF2A [Glycine max]